MAWLCSGHRVPVPMVEREIFQKAARNIVSHMEQLVVYRSRAMFFSPK